LVRSSFVSSLAAKHVPGAALPVISLAGMRSTDTAARAAVGARLERACANSGFFYLIDHGVAPALMAAVFRESRRFFELPLEQKLALDRSKSFCNRGYEPLRDQALEFGTPPDVKEGFYLGVDLPQSDPRVAARTFGFGPNQWPALPGWRETMEAYARAMIDLGALLLRAIALSLRLPEEYFAAYCDDPVAVLRLLRYPPQAANPRPDEKGCGAHTDFGAVTFLLQDDAGGLQVWDEREGWIHAAPMDGAYVVNLGDMMARWTNDRYRSTRHRVVNFSGRERYSVPFFYDGRADYVISCLPGCLEPGEQPKYPPTTPVAHLEQRIRESYAFSAAGATARGDANTD
jgi:isopenicillin N synthase-like dioxygenase